MQLVNCAVTGLNYRWFYLRLGGVYRSHVYVHPLVCLHVIKCQMQDRQTRAELVFHDATSV
jgi:hypothetical protein